LGELHQIYNFGTFGDKHELIKCWGQRTRWSDQIWPDQIWSERRSWHTHRTYGSLSSSM